MFRISVFCILLWVSTYAYNQAFTLSIGSGIGTYQMKDLKTLQNSILIEIPVIAKIVNNFPASPIYSIKAVYRTKKIQAGVKYMFNSSGSRIHYSDYSGEISFVQVVNSHQVGMLFYPVLYSKGKSDILGLLSTAALFNSYSLKQEITVFDQTVSDHMDLKSNSFSFSFGLAYCIRFRPIELRAEAEYLVDFGGPLHLENDPEVEIYDIKNDPINTNLSGFRLGLSAGWYFSRRAQ